jgi:F-type H+-transporting ATPase subunit b
MKIDWWTLGFQTVNVVVLVWLLRHFFWAPVAAAIAARRATAQKTQTDAAAQHASAEAAAKDAALTRAGFAKEREAILAASHAEAEKARAASLDQAKAEVAALRAATAKAMQTEALAADKAWAERSRHLGIDIAGRLAARLDGPTVHAVFLDWLVKAVRALPDSARRAVADQTAALEAVSATPLDEAEQKHATSLIAEAFGGHPNIVYSTDPALIAGLELRAPHLAVSNSWRADLTAIDVRLTHDA